MRSVAKGPGRVQPVRDAALQCEACGRPTLVAAETLFRRSKLPLRLWLRAMWRMTGHRHGASPQGLQRVVGADSHQTAWTCLHELRRSLMRPDRHPQEAGGARAALAGLSLMTSMPPGTSACVSS